MAHNVKPYPTSRRRRDVPQRRPQPQPNQARRTVRAAPGAGGEHGREASRAQRGLAVRPGGARRREHCPERRLRGKVSSWQDARRGHELAAGAEGRPKAERMMASYVEAPEARSFTPAGPDARYGEGRRRAPQACLRASGAGPRPHRRKAGARHRARDPQQTPGPRSLSDHQAPVPGASTTSTGAEHSDRRGELP